MFNPMEGMLKAYWAGVDRAMRASQPQMKAAVRAQIEVGGFVTKRTKAAMELPERFARCKTPMDTFAETMQFWVEGFEDYAEASQRTLRAMGVAQAAPVSRIDDWVPVSHKVAPGRESVSSAGVRSHASTDSREKAAA